MGPQECLVKIADISYIPGWQATRPIDEGTVIQYLEEMNKRVTFPPVEIVRDGDTHWLTDGHHRVESAARWYEQNKKAKAVVRAVVTPGTLEDAIRCAAIANTKHGLPRSPETKQAIVEYLVYSEHSPFRSKTQKEIAQIAGVGQQYVSYVMRRHDGGCEDGEFDDKTALAPTKTDSGEVYASCVNPSTPVEDRPQGGRPRGKPKGKRKPSDVQQVEVKKAAQQPNGEVIPDKDADGVPIPEDLRRVFAERAKFGALLLSLSRFKSEVKAAMKDNPEAWLGFKPQPFESALAQAKQALEWGTPEILCPYCGGRESKSCRNCDGRRWQTWQQSVSCAIDLRNIHRAQAGIEPITKSQKKERNGK